jgi:pectin methylesterase-like acyl-CoA thioesterase
MKRKWLAVGIILLFIGTCIIPSTAQDLEKSQSTLRGDWLYVGGSGPGNYSTIQDAIDNASEGDTIFVYHGWYYEHNLAISKLNLIGEDRDTTIIDGQEIFSEGIRIREGATISGFTIQRFTKHDLTTGPGTGIAIDGNNITISENIITMCTRGIFLRRVAFKLR